MRSLYIGIDNGVTGSIGFVGTKDEFIQAQLKIPTIIQQDYTKKKQNITRISIHELIALFREFHLDNCLAVVERPMINPTRFKASLSAIRCLEATLICLEYLEIPYMFIDSKEWQRELLPQGIKKEQLKKASQNIGIRLFPGYKEFIQQHGDADGLLIAEYARRNNL
jgi:hypothetical protein